MARRFILVLSSLLVTLTATVALAQGEFPGVSIEFLPLVETLPGPSPLAYPASN